MTLAADGATKPVSRAQHEQQLPVAASDQPGRNKPDEEHDGRTAEGDAGEKVDPQRPHHPVVQGRNESPRADDDDDASDDKPVGNPSGAHVLDRRRQGEASDQGDRQGNCRSSDPNACGRDDDCHDGAQRAGGHLADSERKFHGRRRHVLLGSCHVRDWYWMPSPRTAGRTIPARKDVDFTAGCGCSGLSLTPVLGASETPKRNRPSEFWRWLLPLGSRRCCR